MDKPVDLPTLEPAVIGTGDNQIHTVMEPQLLDAAEFYRALHARLFESIPLDPVAGFGTGEPVGILNTPGAITWTPSPPPPPCADEDWGAFRDLINSMFSAALSEWERGMVVDRELQNSRARLFWRAQRRMTINDLADMLDIRYSTALELLGLL